MSFEEWVISRLREHGAYSGAYDGAPGRSMHNGLRKFQSAVGLPVTGFADEDTVEALREPGNSRDFPDRAKPAPTIPAEPIWLREGRRLMGIREVPGAKSNSTIMSWAKRLGGWVASFYTNDDIAWCGLFEAHIISLTLPQEPLPANPLGALQWNKFGYSLSEPCLGAILTFTRSGGGHVGNYVGEDETHFHVLGGNQSDSVRVTRIAKSRLSSVRWPRTGPKPQGGRIFLTAAGVPVSNNEA